MNAISIRLRRPRDAFLLCAVLSVGFVLGRLSRSESRTWQPSPIPALGTASVLESDAAALDAARALQLAARAEHAVSPEARDAAIRALFARWMSEDARAAWDGLGRLAPGALRDELRRDAIAQVARRDPEAALRCTQELSSTAERHRCLRIAIATVADDDPSLAAVMIAALPAGDAQIDAIVSVAERMTSKHAAEAAAWLASLPEGAVKLAATERVIGNLSAADPRAATMWAAELAEHDGAPHLLSQAVASWAGLDAEAAGNWLGTLPPGETRDRALHAYLGRVSANFPALAAPWTLAFSSEEDRVNAIERLARQWLQFDRPAVIAWLARTPFPETRKREILGGQ